MEPSRGRPIRDNQEDIAGEIDKKGKVHSMRVMRRQCFEKQRGIKSIKCCPRSINMLKNWLWTPWADLEDDIGESSFGKVEPAGIGLRNVWEMEKLRQ